MPAGLQVWDASGNVVIDLSTRLSRVIDVIDPGLQNGSRSYPNVANTVFGVVADWYEPVPDSAGTGGVPHVWSSGNTVTWSFLFDPMFRMNSRIIVFGY